MFYHEKVKFSRRLGVDSPPPPLLPGTYFPFVPLDEPYGYAHPIPLIQSAEGAVATPFRGCPTRKGGMRGSGKEKLRERACSRD
ncbi:hypothetical protein CDAR_109311 [Caerostris darwini]|uniref:Uncharacterized protein n=1 Tax=Caerostris darwini TaxID=1538125 RepID=A0AAV4TVB5_9ARAC|nr:hypothetical protein CDAR_109311 [Caerostris darwini]